MNGQDKLAQEILSMYAEPIAVAVEDGRWFMVKEQDAIDAVRAAFERAGFNDLDTATFDSWAEKILGDNPNWRESGEGELARQAWKAALASAKTVPVQNPDDVAVDSFAAAMKAKMAAARAKGRGGWEDPAQCTADDLSRMLRDHVDKGDPRDVANFCMMLHQRGEVIE